MKTWRFTFKCEYFGAEWILEEVLGSGESNHDGFDQK